MSRTSAERLTANLEHARWGVAFRQSLLDAHRTSAKSGAEWLRKDAELAKWVDDARSELARLDLQ
jgi:hypothetical protein